MPVDVAPGALVGARLRGIAVPSRGRTEVARIALGPADAGEDPRYLQEQLITYIGNKRALLPFIGRGVDEVKRRLGKRRLRMLDARMIYSCGYWREANDLDAAQEAQV